MQRLPCRILLDCHRPSVAGSLVTRVTLVKEAQRCSIVVHHTDGTPCHVRTERDDWHEEEDGGDAWYRRETLTLTYADPADITLRLDTNCGATRLLLPLSQLLHQWQMVWPYQETCWGPRDAHFVTVA